jgi:RNA polymerase sigma-70 factor (ECF subfamily)
VDQAPGPAISTTLLVRLQQRPADEAAWSEFVLSYGQRIQRWCRRWGLQEADAQDVSQTVLLKLLRAVQTVRDDPGQKFQGWLKTVTHHAWQDLARGRRRAATGYVAAAGSPLRTLATRDDVAARLQRAHEHELLDQALARVRPRVQPQTWNAFRLTTLDGLPGVAVAARLGIAVNSVYKARSNVRKLLGAEVRYLEGGAP